MPSRHRLARETLTPSVNRNCSPMLQREKSSINYYYCLPVFRVQSTETDSTHFRATVGPLSFHFSPTCPGWTLIGKWRSPWKQWRYSFLCYLKRGLNYTMTLMGSQPSKNVANNTNSMLCGQLATRHGWFVLQLLTVVYTTSLTYLMVGPVTPAV